MRSANLADICLGSLESAYLQLEDADLRFVGVACEVFPLSLSILLHHRSYQRGLGGTRLQYDVVRLNR
jgi:hypothetical protein